MASKELVVSQNRHETKVAILEDGQLMEVYFQRSNEYSLAGSIHKGRVTRVLPGMQSAFVDLGLDRDCFLYVSDFWEEHGEEYDKVGGDDRRRERRPEPAAMEAAPPVAERLPPAESAEDAGTAAGPADSDHRRRRRRRRGGRGFPESKYAGQGAGSAEPSELAETEEAAAGPEPAEDVFLLPGESLAKYRGRPAGSDPDGVPGTDEAEDGEDAGTPDQDETEVVIEAGGAETADDVAEAVLARVEEIEDQYGISEVEEPEDADEPEEAEESAEAGEEAEADDDRGAGEPPAGEEEVEDARDLDSRAGRMDIGISFSFDVEPPAATLGDAAGESPASTGASAPEPGADASEAREAAETADVEPARMPVSLTAQLRERGGRLPHRVNRRMRRRGRGGRGFEAPETPAEVEAPASAPEVTVVQAEEPARPPRQERDRDRGRDRVRDRDRDRERDQDRERPKTALPSIADLLKEGQEIIVQIAKEPLGQKGARITSHIALPGRYVVYMPTVEHLGVSRKISTEEERLRLKRILQKHRQDVPGGYIMRTAGEDKSEDDIASDMKYLANLWQEIRTKSDKRRAPALLHHDVQVVERLLRDQLTEGFKAVWVDSEELFEGVLHTVERMQPALLARVKLYTRAEPIFDAFGITQELEKALRPKVWLRSGGYIVINQTEALVAIDVNTGKYVGKSNRLEDTIVKTNLEAVREISRQVRLRDLGGIIVIDFIDMDERKNRQKVMQALEDAMRADKAPYKILQFNDFGLVAVTRKRVKQSLERALCAPCPMCEGAGYVKSVQTVIGEIMGQAQKYAKVVDGKECLLRVHPDAAKVLKSTQNKYLEELEEILGRPVLVTADAQLHPEKFDLT